MKRPLFLIASAFTLIACRTRSLNDAQPTHINTEDAYKFFQLPPAMYEAALKFDSKKFQEGKKSSADGGFMAAEVLGYTTLAVSVIDRDNTPCDRDRAVGRIDCEDKGVRMRAVFQTGSDMRAAHIFIQEKHVSTYWRTNENYSGPVNRFEDYNDPEYYISALQIQFGYTTMASQIFASARFPEMAIPANKRPSRLESPGAMRNYISDMETSSKIKKSYRQVELILK